MPASHCREGTPPTLQHPIPLSHHRHLEEGEALGTFITASQASIGPRRKELPPEVHGLVTPSHAVSRSGQIHHVSLHGTCTAKAVPTAWTYLYAYAHATNFRWGFTGIKKGKKSARCTYT